ncbi:MAG: leucine-rich repeat domain-containing protein [Clostridiaceae bacterium]|nr:leucine-rich repeat domain-containing protein [Clostridiaceae bacterium]
MPSKNFYFKFDKINSTIKGYSGNPPSKLVIPFNISGTLVTKIADYSFYNQNLSEVIIPNSITEIGNFAFASNNLTKLTIPENVISLGISSFSNNSLSELSILSQYININSYSFSNNILLTVIIPSNANLQKYAFDPNVCIIRKFYAAKK